MAAFDGFKGFVEDLSENQLAGITAIKLLGIGIIIAVVVYSEFLFLGIINVILPEGVVRFGAVAGAVATGISVVVLVGAKILWVTPGGQMLWSWTFMILEVAILALNDMLAYALHQGPVSGVLASWQAIMPAGPLMAMLGWIFMLFLDSSQVERHKDMELEAKRAKSERRYKEVSHRAEMHLKHAHLNQVTSRLQDVINSPEIQARIVAHAERMVDQVLTDVSGIASGSTMTSTSALPPARPTIVSAAQEAETAPPPFADEEEPSRMTQAIDYVKSLFPSRSAETTAGTPVQPAVSPDDMAQLLQMYQESGDNGVMSFPEWLKQLYKANSQRPK